MSVSRLREGFDDSVVIIFLDTDGTFELAGSSSSLISGLFARGIDIDPGCRFKGRERWSDDRLNSIGEWGAERALYC